MLWEFHTVHKSLHLPFGGPYPYIVRDPFFPGQLCVLNALATTERNRKGRILGNLLSEDIWEDI